MGKVIDLPDNLIGIEDHQKLESFGAHEISHGRATRFHWDQNENDDPVFEVYAGGIDETLVIKITRDRKKDEFQAENKNSEMIAHGPIDYVMKVLDEKLTRGHDESETPA